MGLVSMSFPSVGIDTKKSNLFSRDKILYDNEGQHSVNLRVCVIDLKVFLKTLTDTT